MTLNILEKYKKAVPKFHRENSKTTQKNVKKKKLKILLCPWMGRLYHNDTFTFSQK